jgi:polyphosphate kinase 2
MSKKSKADDVKKLKSKKYDKELRKLQGELCQMQEWVKHKGLRVMIVFEGRDGAGKGGTIKAITERVSPRVFRVIALPAPSDREKSQMYIQRYMKHFPAAGEVVIFDRSWYNRAGVERVMGFCTEEEYREFRRSVPEFERMLIRSGILLIKYWFSVGDDEQERRFQARLADPAKHWKLSPMDLTARSKWVEYSKAKDAMFEFSDIEEAPWWVVRADSKRRARLNCISHLLSMVAYRDVPRKKISLPPRPKARGHRRPPQAQQHFVPERY